MRFCFIFILGLLSFNFASAEISFYYDVSSTVKLSQVAEKTFLPFNSKINKGYSKGNYWFKITENSKDQIVQFPNRSIHIAEAFQNGKLLLPMEDQRFLSYEILKGIPTYIKIKATKEAYIQIKTFSPKKFEIHERNQFLLIGFYYGFAIVVIIINLFYFITIKDFTFIYYSFFILFVSLGLIISDGIFEYFGVPYKLTDNLQAIEHSLVAFFGAHFAMYYLQSNQYYPNLKKWNWMALAILTAVCLTYVFTSNFLFYILIELLVFSILSSWWITGTLLFNKNVFSKIFVIAYIFILIMGIDYYVLKLLGLKFLGITATHVKIGGFIEMLFLSYAVVYRMKILKNENNEMRLSLEKYLTKVKALSNELEKLNAGEENVFSKYQLSYREGEILNEIATGKTNKEIANTLNISVNTVKYHVKKVYDKLEVSSRTEVASKIKIA